MPEFTASDTEKGPLWVVSNTNWRYLSSFTSATATCLSPNRENNYFGVQVSSLEYKRTAKYAKKTCFIFFVLFISKPSSGFVRNFEFSDHSCHWLHFNSSFLQVQKNYQLMTADPKDRTTSNVQKPCRAIYLAPLPVSLVLSLWNCAEGGTACFQGHKGKKMKSKETSVDYRLKKREKINKNEKWNEER